MSYRLGAMAMGLWMIGYGLHGNGLCTFNYGLGRHWLWVLSMVSCAIGQKPWAMDSGLWALGYDRHSYG